MIQIATCSVGVQTEQAIIEPWHDKTNKMSVRPVKTQISLGIRPVWSESSLCAQWVAKDPSCLHADSEDSDQTGRMPKLIWVFAWCTLILLVLSWGGSVHERKPVKSWNEQGTSCFQRKNCIKFIIWFEPHHKKICWFHMQTTKAQISLHIYLHSLISAFVVDSI